MTTLEFAQRNLFGPLNIHKVMWETKNRHYAGGFGLHLSIYDMAKLGQLFLQKGRWKGKQIVSEKWVQEATKAALDCNYPGIDIKYGYQWWVHTTNGHKGYRAHGRGGQFVVVFPDLDMVIAVNSIIDPIQRQPSMHYDYLFHRITQAID